MLPEKRIIGIIGGGQLGKMLIEASRPWNVQYVVLEGAADCPAGELATEVIEGSLYDAEKIKYLASKCDILTFEIEHINVDVLLELEAEGKTIIPSPKTLQIIQDKGLQKNYYTKNNVPTARYYLAKSIEELTAGLPQLEGKEVVVKTCTGGYDGKGVEIVKKADIINKTYQINGPVIVEELVSDIIEYAVIVAKATDGQITTFPVIEMYFNPISNLVEFLFSPSGLNDEMESKCKGVAINAVKHFTGGGLFAVELFVTGDNEILVNEIAPRPHNSGHHTIEGNYTSQFEQLNRILLDYPLGSTNAIMPAAMINLVGPENLSGAYSLKNQDTLMAMEGVYVHLYNKKNIKPNRKMGHITVLADSKDGLLQKSVEVKKLAGFQ